MKFIEISEIRKKNLLICGENFFKIYEISSKNKGKIEIQNEKKDGIIKIIESKNGYLLSVSKNNGGSISIWKYDTIKNYKEIKEIKLDIVPSNLFLEMNDKAFCIYLTDENLYFYEKNSEANYIQKSSITNFKYHEKDNSKIYKYNDDIVIFTNYLNEHLKNIKFISLERNAIIFNYDCCFDLNDIIVLSNNVILAVTNDDSDFREKFIIRELVYDKHKQKITTIKIYHEGYDETIEKVVEIEKHRLIILSNLKILEAWDMLNI